MIHPTPSELLERIADALTTTVLPELEPHDARVQLQVAVLILRRLAGLAGDVVPYLDADNRDIATTIGKVLPEVQCSGSAAASALVSETSSSEPVPATADLVARNEQLQALLVELLHAVHGLPPDSETRRRVDGELRALITRMLARERVVHTTFASW